jgi:hypothetical protein
LRIGKGTPAEAVAKKKPVEADLLASVKRILAWWVEEEILGSHPATPVKNVGEEARERMLYNPRDPPSLERARHESAIPSVLSGSSRP